jgi:hypothetical protein
MESLIRIQRNSGNVGFVEQHRLYLVGYVAFHPVSIMAREVKGLFFDTLI